MLDHAFRRRREIERMMLAGKKLTVSGLMDRYCVGRKSISRDFVHRRMEIINILSAKRHITTRELAWKFGVTRRTILHDIVALSFDYPIYTKPGEGGGIFITENFFRIIHKYGADKLKIKAYFICDANEKASLIDN